MEDEILHRGLTTAQAIRVEALRQAVKIHINKRGPTFETVRESAARLEAFILNGTTGN